MENVRKLRSIKFVITERRRTYLVSELNYHITKFFKENLLVKEMRKTQILMSEPVFLGLSILDLNKTNVYILVWFVKPKNGEKEKHCYMEIDSFIVHGKKVKFCKYIAEDLETRSDTFETDRSLPDWKIQKVIGLMKDQLNRVIIKNLVD